MLYYYPDDLSWGQKQRVAIARALLGRPKIVLASVICLVIVISLWEMARISQLSGILSLLVLQSGYSRQHNTYY